MLPSSRVHVVLPRDLTSKSILSRVSLFNRGVPGRDVAKHLKLGGGWGQGSNFIAAIAAIAVEREQNAVDHCGNDGNFLPYSAIFILFTVHYYFDT